MKPHSLRKTVLCLSIAAAFSSTVASATGVAQAQWNGSVDGQWTDSNNWDGSLPPQAGGDALVTDSALTGNAVTDVTYTNPGDANPGSVADSLDWVVVDGAPSSNMTLNQGTDNLSTSRLTVGESGTGIYNMTGGSLAVTLDDVNVDTLTLGRQDNSVGTFNQSGGDVTVGRVISLGQTAGSIGTYNLNTGSSVSGFITMGFGGYGELNQQAGTTNTVGSDIYMNNAAYNLTGGSLTVNGTQGVIVGTVGTSTFAQTGGTLAITQGNLTVGNQGTGTFIQHAGEHTVGGDLIIASQASAGGSSFTLDTTARPSSLAVSGNLVVGQEGKGTLTQDGGSNTVDHTLVCRPEQHGRRE